MRVEVFFTPHQVDEMYLRVKTVAVIDVLRASTTIATALHNGAKEVIPVATVESAMKIAGNLSSDVTLLGGERAGKKIEGFDLGNSPREYIAERVKGKSLVFATTNGSLAMVKARNAKEMLVVGFVNMTASVNFLPGRDLTILCSGRSGNFSIEDAVCAGMLIQQLQTSSDEELELDDAGDAAIALYKNHNRSLGKMLAASEHGRYLTEIGFGDDLTVCGAVDTVPVLPLLISNVVKLKSLERNSIPS